MSDGKLVILAGGISSRMKKPEKLENIDPQLIKDADLKAKSMIGVGANYRPFLDYLLFNAKESGYKDIVIVIGENDNSIREYYGYKDINNDFWGINISYAVQKIPEGREKPLGTADALYQALLLKNEWRNSRFSVCNSDNLYSQKALSLVLNAEYQNAMIDYDRNALEFEESRIEKFAITIKDNEGYLLNIIEKPTKEEIKKIEKKTGFVGVSMNLFSFHYKMIFPYLEKVPIHPERKEKELPIAVVLMINDYPKSVFTYRFAEHVPDLTYKNDIVPVKNYLAENFKKLFH